ncbi:MAG: hypothetical protein WCT03_02575 [Candidatus Obscuribacterales bacterium]
MSTQKKSITFYAANDVAEWIETLDAGEKSRKINELIREAVLNPKPKTLFQIPLGFYQMSTLLQILKDVEAAREKQEDEVDGEDMASTRAQTSEVSSLVAHFEQFVK